jgi:tRNA(fMet)-specific endonuclease VapC
VRSGPGGFPPVNKALIDTDIFSELGKGVDQRVVQNAAAYQAAFGQYTISAVTVMEIVRGLRKKQATARLQAFLASIVTMEVLPFDEAAAEPAGQIEGDLERIGQPVGRADPMIAAIALRGQLELITGNTAHYQRIQQLGHPLVLGNWRK